MYLPVMRQVCIVGGGLSGLTLAILLRRAGAPVRLWDAAGYPRHRVCGEFVSGRGADLLAGLLPSLVQSAARIRDVRFFADGRSSSTMLLPASGLAISRWDLDERLALEYLRDGGDLKVGRWQGDFDSEGMVRSSGRRLSKSGRTWTGIKAHISLMHLQADLEMHFSAAGYLGVARLPEGANLCALIQDRSCIGDFRANPAGVFARLLDRPDRLAGVQFDPQSISAVSGISFATSADGNECCVGDALRMIPPFTGNGMSLAIESAFLAAPILCSYSRGDIVWGEAVKRVRGACQRAFRKRFYAADWLRRVADRSWTRRLMLSSLKTHPLLLRLCFRLTR
jgi:flavin-dependent dehydrogenase